jgi:hypothetical protein
MSNNDELCLSFFNEGGNVVKTELNNEGLASFLWVSTAGFGFSFLLESSFLFFFSLWLVFCKQFKKLRS